MSRKIADAQRSLRRYLGFHLPSYDVRTEPDEGAFARPAISIDTIPAVYSNRNRFLEVTQPFTIYGYPAAGEDPLEAEDNARALEESLIQACEIGGYGGYPRRIPLHDFDGLDRDEPLVPVPEEDEEPEPEPEPDGYMWVMDFSTEVRVDPDDELLRTVIGELRVRWRRLSFPNGTGQGGPGGEGPIVDVVGSRPSSAT
jgi:hypothetical protein